MPAVLQQILALPANIHLAVRLTAIKLVGDTAHGLMLVVLLQVGELCEWIERHPETLEATLNYLLQVTLAKLVGWGRGRGVDV